MPGWSKMFSPAAAIGRFQRNTPLKNICSVVITLVLHVQEEKERAQWNRLLVERAGIALARRMIWETESVRVKEEERECKWCRACRMLCGLQDGVHANGGTQPYCYLARAAGRAQRSISVMYMYSQVALKWDGGGQKQDKPCGQSRALSCMKAGLQNLISLTALTAGFERVWGCWVHWDWSGQYYHSTEEHCKL